MQERASRCRSEQGMVVTASACVGTLGSYLAIGRSPGPETKPSPPAEGLEGSKSVVWEDHAVMRSATGRRLKLPLSRKPSTPSPSALTFTPARASPTRGRRRMAEGAGDVVRRRCSVRGVGVSAVAAVSAISADLLAAASAWHALRSPRYHIASDCDAYCVLPVATLTSWHGARISSSRHFRMPLRWGRLLDGVGGGVDCRTLPLPIRELIGQPRAGRLTRCKPQTSSMGASHSSHEEEEQEEPERFNITVRPT
jgi:hypothetical protein